jgi:hypothetical protein
MELTAAVKASSAAVHQKRQRQEEVRACEKIDFLQ